jgi:MFS family permease
VGTQASSLVYALLTLALTGSTAKAGLVGFARLAPIGALSLLAGVAADRLDRKRIMLAADAVRGLTIGALAVSLAVGRPPFAAIVAAALVEGTGDTFFRPAAAGATRSVVPARQLADASSTTQARLATVRVVGPPLGGALYGIGRAVPFVFDALSYVGSLITVLLMRTPFQDARAATGERIRAELRDGVRFLWSQHFLRTMALLLMVTNIVVAGALLTVVVAGREQGLSGGEIGAIIAGRVNSVLSTIAVAAAPVGTLGAGVALGAAGARATVGALAGLALLVAIVGTLSPSMRTAPDLDRLDAVTASR